MSALISNACDSLITAIRLAIVTVRDVSIFHSFQ